VRKPDVERQDVEALFLQRSGAILFFLLLIKTKRGTEGSIKLKSKLSTALQRHNTENSKQIFPGKELRGYSPNFNIDVSVSDLYIPLIGIAYSAVGQYVGRTWEYIDCSQTHECGNWDRGRAIPFLGTHKFKFICSANTVQLRLHSLQKWRLSCSLSTVWLR
jgi:hypothetical protein